MEVKEEEGGPMVIGNLVGFDLLSWTLTVGGGVLMRKWRRHWSIFYINRKRWSYPQKETLIGNPVEKEGKKEEEEEEEGIFEMILYKVLLFSSFL